MNEYQMSPGDFLRSFPDEESFRFYLTKIDLLNDLRHMRDVFEDNDEFEYCRFIQDEIDSRVDRMLSGFGFE